MPANPLELLCDFAPASAGSGDRQVCNCHAVSESTIVAAIKDGAHGVEAVGRVCRAGTGCGSCRSQTAVLVKRHAVASPAAV